jgi:hypothetical protein
VNIVNCQYWSSCGKSSCCAKNLYGGRPSPGVCNTVCTERKPHSQEELADAEADYYDRQLPPEPEVRSEPAGPSFAKKVGHGIVGNAKALLGADAVTPEVLKARQDICNTCDKKTSIVRGLTTKCSVCGCILPSKQRLSKERCPIGKWDSISTTISLPVLKGG